MPIQTATVRVQKREDGYYLEVDTPDGTLSIPTPGDIRGMDGYQSFTSYHRKVEPPKTKEVSKKRQKKASIQQELDVMEALGGKRQAGSGAIGHLKGDGRVRGKYRVEMKYTRHDSYRVERKELNKIRGECTDLEKPLFVVDFQNPQSGRVEDRWVLVPFEEFLKLDKTKPEL